MPYSDKVPSYVFPDSPAWRDRAREVDLPVLAEMGASYRYCTEYKDGGLLTVQDSKFMRRDWYPCANRTARGERNHNWCMRCPAGFMLIPLHIYDADRDRDRAVLL